MKVTRQDMAAALLESYRHLTRHRNQKNSIDQVGVCAASLKSWLSAADRPTAVLEEAKWMHSKFWALHYQGADLLTTSLDLMDIAQAVVHLPRSGEVDALDELRWRPGRKDMEALGLETPTSSARAEEDLLSLGAYLIMRIMQVSSRDTGEFERVLHRLEKDLDDS